MTFIRADFHSKELNMSTSAQVLLPDDRALSRVRVVYLLHGLSDNCTGWLRRTAVERYAQEYGVAVVMPEVQRSFYTDMQYGVNYFSYVYKELPEIMHRLFARPPIERPITYDFSDDSGSENSRCMISGSSL